MLGRRAPATGDVRATVVAEADQAPVSGLPLRSDIPGARVDTSCINRRHQRDRSNALLPAGRKIDRVPARRHLRKSCCCGAWPLAPTARPCSVFTMSGGSRANQNPADVTKRPKGACPVHGVALGMKAHAVTDAAERRVPELLPNNPIRDGFRRRLALRFAAERQPRDRLQAALHPDCRAHVIPRDVSAPRVPAPSQRTRDDRCWP